MTGEILDKFSQLITTALGLVAALAWNDAIQTVFQQFLGTSKAALLFSKRFTPFEVSLLKGLSQKPQPLSELYYPIPERLPDPHIRCL